MSLHDARALAIRRAHEREPLVDEPAERGGVLAALVALSGSAFGLLTLLLVPIAVAIATLKATGALG